MAKIPKDPGEIFPELACDYRKLFGEGLVSIILFGSGAGEDYLPGKSDLNFLITLTEPAMEGFERALETVSRWRGRSVAIPLFMTREHLAGALDAYPIEFLNMKRSYRVVTGQDVLAGLAFDPRHIRLQLERELGGKLLHLRSGYLAAGGKTKKIRELIAVSVTAFVSLFGAVLFLRNMALPGARRDIVTQGAAALGVDPAVFLKCEQVRAGTDRFSPAEVEALFRDYVRQVGRLCGLVDRMDQIGG